MRNKFFCIKLSRKKIIVSMLLMFVVLGISYFTFKQFFYYDKNRKQFVREYVELANINNGDKLSINKEEVTNASTNVDIVLPEEINGFKVIGSIKIPKINLDTYILETTTDESLKESVTKLCGTSINTQGNMCIAGHNFNNKKMFGKVHKLNVGDQIAITDIYGRSMDYYIYDIYTTSPDDVSCIKQDEEGTTQITLITCTTAAIKRLIVKAKVVYD